jgi:hypothetical protein
LEKDPETQLRAQIYYRFSPTSSPVRLTNDLNDYGESLSVTRDGRSVVAVQSQVIAAIYTGESAAPDRAGPVSSASDERDAEDWTTDGKVLVQDWAGHLFLQDPDNSGSSPLAAREFSLVPAMCGDGKSLVYATLSAGNAVHIVYANVANARGTEITNGRSDWLPACSPDGTWVAYMAHESGSWVVMRTASSGGKAQPLYSAAGDAWRPTISEDGKYVGFVHETSAHKGRFLVVPSDGGAPVHEISVPANSEDHRLTRDGSGFTYVLHDGDVDNLWYQAFAGGPPKQLTHFNPNSPVFSKN